jgi:hypothetical protein
MRTLAIAVPNKKYRWYKNLASVTIEARLVNNEVRYFEFDAGKEKRISVEEVEAKFLVDHPIKKQPFLVQKNRDFYAILNRHRAKYQERFIEIKNTLPCNKK